VQTNPSSPCLISWPSTSLPLVGSVGGGCLISKTNVRAWIGGGLILLGALGAVPAVIILAAAGFRRSGLAGKAADVAGVFPGGQGYAAALRTVDQGSARPAAAYRQSQARQERGRERALGEPRENARLRTGRGAVRETPAGTRRRRAERDDEPPF
jgi:hypothetical protein